jgi:predicted PurR-regulated permease PerM
MTSPRVGSRSERALVVLTATVVSVAAITLLYWAQSIFIPLALAAFLTFLLSPLVSSLRRLGIGRTPAVIATVFSAAVGLGLTGWLVTTQISGLLDELPSYTKNVTKKVKTLRAMTLGSSRLGKMIAEINDELGGHSEGPPGHERSGDESKELVTPLPPAVVIEPQTSVWMGRMTSFLKPILEYLGELALALVLAVFMLQKREELRNRMICLIGDGQIALATKFVDEAGQKISRFLLMQAIVNGTFGALLSAGLLAIGVKYALVWGFLAAMFRYLPYIGPLLAAVPPVCLSLAMFDGWGPTLLIIGLFLVLELIVANAIEPWLYGQSIGVSEIALLVSAAFWAFLWGPIGLVLSSPLTVCLVMLGRYVPHLRFLGILLGDEQVLDPDVSFFQRLLARDKCEADELVRDRLKTEPPDSIYDSMLLPALSATRLSRLRGEITDDDSAHVIESIDEMVTDLAKRDRNAERQENEVVTSNSQHQPAGSQPIALVGCPARGSADRVGLQMLENLLEPNQWRMEIAPSEILASELLEEVAKSAPAAVCIMAIYPGGRAKARYFSKRLRRRFPNLEIVVCCAGRPGAGQGYGNDLIHAGAGAETTSLLETHRRLASLRPVLESCHPPRQRQLQAKA